MLFSLIGMKVVDVSAFGKYVKFYETKQAAVGQATAVEQSSVPRNAFTVLMASSQARSIRPSKTSPIRNKKDSLYNVILDWIEKEGLFWKSGEVEHGTASTAIHTLQDVLWFIDGHHRTLTERCCHVPSVFSEFVGFNRPELSRHKKRSSSSLSCDLLKSHSQRLFGNLQSPFWSRSCWSTVKREVELLAQALARYADLLTSKRARITALHHSDTPAQMVANGLTVDFIKSRHTVPSVLEKFTEAILEAGTNVPVDLDPLLPGDRRRRYNLIQVLKDGLNSSAVLATYSTGSNIGSLHWLWLSDATDISSALQSCQPVIESLRSEMPQYHRMLDLDYMCATRTAPHNSYRNPVERVMAVLNLGLQSVGLA